jgi:hypothetical protein
MNILFVFTPDNNQFLLACYWYDTMAMVNNVVYLATFALLFAILWDDFVE